MILVLYNLLKKYYYSAAFWYGLVVHFKIYPILYALPIYFYIDHGKNKFFTKNRLIFTFVSASLFIYLTWFFYHIYGYESLYESLLYHLVRKDNRHNFSLYFYFIYLNFDNVSIFYSILTFVP